MPSVTEILDTMDYGTAPEANTHVVEWLKAHEAGFGHFVNGAFTKPSTQSFDVVNPATGSVVKEYPTITDAELDANPGLVRSMSVQPPRGLGRVRVLEIEGVVGVNLSGMASARGVPEAAEIQAETGRAAAAG